MQEQERQTEDRPDSMELRVIINALARASVSKQETERLRLQGLTLIDKIEDN